MTYLFIKTLLSALIIVAVAEIAKRSPALGALVVSLPLLSILAMIWLWRDTHDPERMAAHVQSTFFYVLPSLPMFLLIPALLRGGTGFWASLLAGCALTALLYLATVMVAARFGIRL